MHPSSKLTLPLDTAEAVFTSQTLSSSSLIHGHVPQQQYQIFARIESVPARGILKLCSAMSVRLSLATVGDGMPISGLLRAWLLHAGLGPKVGRMLHWRWIDW
ncbi:hypothetical protein BDN71DRAFT_285753 [Pleurotus eryngii]|uniref:Uncharacterized protein n=1 Tax=Pleurotus eryngii TaxID=5323 RepID=A0A9P5ZLV2_PLEER|nr:hypothetical protein BDN71DRAFT_285753 [Pleurotus eryngii]